jgi:hypothetical protein
MMHDAFADLVGVIEDTVVEGDKIAARVTRYGTRRGDFVGIPGPDLLTSDGQADALQGVSFSGR